MKTKAVVAAALAIGLPIAAQAYGGSTDWVVSGLDTLTTPGEAPAPDSVGRWLGPNSYGGEVWTRPLDTSSIRSPRTDSGAGPCGTDARRLGRDRRRHLASPAREPWGYKARMMPSRTLSDSTRRSACAE